MSHRYDHRCLCSNCSDNEHRIHLCIKDVEYRGTNELTNIGTTVRALGTTPTTNVPSMIPPSYDGTIGSIIASFGK